MAHRCSNCGGTGYAKCPRCWGSGRFNDGSTCYYCQDSDVAGKVKCPACNGSGEIDD